MSKGNLIGGLVGGMDGLEEERLKGVEDENHWEEDEDGVRQRGSQRRRRC